MLSTATKPEGLALLKRSGWIDFLIEEIETIGPEPLQGFRVSPQLFFIKRSEKEPFSMLSLPRNVSPRYITRVGKASAATRTAEKIDRHCGVP